MTFTLSPESKLGLGKRHMTEGALSYTGLDRNKINILHNKINV